MGYEISYNHITNKRVKQEKAIRDCYLYLPITAYNHLYTLAMECADYRQFSSWIHFAGITGYPAVAFWNDMKQTCQDMTQ